MTHCTEVASEEWRPVVGFERLYEVSSAGRIRRKSSQQIRRLFLDKSGRPSLTLRAENKTFPRRVHNLVAEAFLSPKPRGQEVNHIDGNKSNNAIGNLEYVTRKENMEHYWNLVSPEVSSSVQMIKAPKLTKEQVLEIRSKANTISSKQLAAEYGVFYTTINSIKSGRAWKHLLSEA